MNILDGSVEVSFDLKKIHYGCYHIEIVVEYKSEKIRFFNITRNTMIFDEYIDLKADNTSYEDLQEYLYDLYYEIFEDRILEFCYNIDNN